MGEGGKEGSFTIYRKEMYLEKFLSVKIDINVFKFISDCNCEKAMIQ